MSTPYVTPTELNNMPLGIAWTTLPNPRSVDSTEVMADICWRATAEVDGIVNQMLRASVNGEELQGPNFRLTVSENGNGIFTTSFWPIIDVINGEVKDASSFSASWQTVGAANVRQYEKISTAYAAVPPNIGGTGLNLIEIAPSYVSWLAGRKGTLVRVWYVNGWPHAGITQAATAGETQLVVDDVTGWLGYTGMTADGSANESFTVVGVAAASPVTLSTGDVVQVGPGTLTLQSPLINAHAVGISASTLPWDVKWATGLFAAAEALTRGATAIAAQQMHGVAQQGTGGAEAFRKIAKEILAPYRAII